VHECYYTAEYGPGINPGASLFYQLVPFRLPTYNFGSPSLFRRESDGSKSHLGSGRFRRFLLSGVLVGTGEGGEAESVWVCTVVG
jgi:hypothetical protein